MYSIIVILVFLIEAGGIAAAVHAVMNTRTSQGAIAWGISLVTIPFVALPLYAIFGRSRFNGYVSLRNIRDEKARAVIQQCQRAAEEKGLIHTDYAPSDTALVRMAQLPMTRFNASRLFVNGQEAFASILESIVAAQHYILVQYFIVRDDALGRRLKSALAAKAREGVRVYFLYDEIGSYQLPGHFTGALRNAGVATSAFHTTRGKTNRLQLNFRNHRKIVVADGAVAFIGGSNVGDEYVSEHPKFGPWRDTHVRVMGPVVKAIQYSFLQDWYWATNTLPEFDWHLAAAKGGTENHLLIASGPADPMDTCALMFTHVINSAQERIWIASPYFVPDSRVLGALKLAVLRGVDVRILLPEKPDHRSVYLASFSFYPEILSLGVQLYRYTPGFMHQKVFLVDSSCAAVGTANLDNRSFRLNFELTLLNYDPVFIKDIETMLIRDFAQSRKVALADYTERPFLFQVAVRFARLLAPVL